MKKATLHILTVALGFMSSQAIAQSQDTDFAAIKQKISEECREQASVLADAKWEKWKKSPNYKPDKLTAQDYSVVFEVLQQQCVSVRNVVMLRLMKSRISTKDAADMKIDQTISEQMLIIEKTL